MNESVISTNEGLIMSHLDNLLPDNLSMAFDVRVHVVNKWSEWLLSCECMGGYISTWLFFYKQIHVDHPLCLLCCIPMKLRWGIFLLISDFHMIMKQCDISFVSVQPSIKKFPSNQTVEDTSISSAGAYNYQQESLLFYITEAS